MSRFHNSYLINKLETFLDEPEVQWEAHLSFTKKTTFWGFPTFWGLGTVSLCDYRSY